MKKEDVIARITDYHGTPMLPALALQELFKDRNFPFIRQWLEDHELDRHMMLELSSTEIAIITPYGVMMEIRAADNGMLGLPGGVLRGGETMSECAVREVWEELGLRIDQRDLTFVEDNLHTHEYANGDKALFRCCRFVCKMQDIPLTLEVDEESLGVEIVKEVTDDILPEQQEFVGRCITKYLL